MNDATRRNEQHFCSAAEWLQEVLQKSCKSAGLQQSQILAELESPLTAINSAFAAVQKIPESRSALQSGFEKTKNTPYSQMADTREKTGA